MQDFLGINIVSPTEPSSCWFSRLRSIPTYPVVCVCYCVCYLYTLTCFRRFPEMSSSLPSACTFVSCRSSVAVRRTFCTHEMDKNVRRQDQTPAILSVAESEHVKLFLAHSAMVSQVQFDAIPKQAQPLNLVSFTVPHHSYID